MSDNGSRLGVVAYFKKRNDMGKPDMPKFPKMRMDYTIPFWRRAKVQKEMDNEHDMIYNKMNKL